MIALRGSRLRSPTFGETTSAAREGFGSAGGIRRRRREAAGSTARATSPCDATIVRHRMTMKTIVAP